MRKQSITKYTAATVAVCMAASLFTTVPAYAAGLRDGVTGETETAQETVAQESATATAIGSVNPVARNGITSVTADQANTYIATAAVQDQYTSLCSDIAIANVEGSVNVRTEPNTTSDVVGKVYTGCQATIVATVDGEGGQWYQIESGNVSGYIKTDYFLTGEDAAQLAMDNGKVYIVSNAAGLRVHEDASLESSVVTTMYEQQTAQVNSINDDYINVSTVDYDEEECSGYVYAGYTELYVECDEAVTLEEEQAMLAEKAAAEAEAAQSAEEAAEAAEQAQAAAEAAAARAAASNSAAAQVAAEQAAAAAQQAAAAAQQAQQSGGSSAAATTTSASGARGTVVSAALSKVGCAYLWGASGPSAYDCSGLVQAAYASVGIGLAHYSGAQAGAGTQVPVSQAQPGDILWRSGHVGIYIGNGQYVHAADYGIGVIVSNLSSSSFSCAVNVLG